ncbi:5-oxoprolinase [Deltaproteobacteria bacterium]|nr:5-oxoprolinase [Deltaproteobacteria bacterium]
MPPTRTFVDRGGTFTDVVTVSDTGVSVRKVPSDAAVVGDLACGALVFGTTVATNALLERRLVPVTLVVTRGFGDLVRIGDMTRPDLFDPDLAWPEPLCAAVVEVEGRFGPDGAEVDRLSFDPAVLANACSAASATSLAVVTFGSGWNPAHELAIAAALPPGVSASLGHRFSPEVGYLTRIETTLLDAAVTPVLHAALRQDRIPAGAMAIRSDGGLVAACELRAPDAVLSGPAGGVLAVAAVAELAGVQLAIGLDMGGTSTDVCLVEGGQLPRREAGWRIDGLRVGRAALEVETIAAGGGSVLGHDGVGWTVGPASAGANPGPQAWGRGGPPTLTDAAIAAGLVDVGDFPRPLSLDRIELPGPAEAFLAVAQEAMAAAVRRIGLRRGIDVREGALVAFGGAAGQHACAVADRLGVNTVLVHVCASVLSAWGQALARRSEESVAAIWLPLGEAWPAVEAAWARLEAGLPRLGAVCREVELRAVGTDAAIAVQGVSAEAVSAAFDAEHRRRYGFVRASHRLEVVNVRVRATAPQGEPLPAPDWPASVPERVYGPARIPIPGSTVVVGEGWEASREGALLRLRRVSPRDRVAIVDRPTELSLWGGRFAAVAADAGEVLRRLARSVNIRERLDFSCAVFDAEGTLVANAPHVPVHLGAMGETVRDVLAAIPDPQDGDSWLTNDPQAGGSHLPDLTVVRCVQAGGERFFVANRAHHVDVGGLTPGSMPPGSRTLADEGLVFRRFPLVRHGHFSAPDLTGSRDPETVRLDLEAQVAANEAAARGLVALGPPRELSAWMGALVAAVQHAVAARLPSLSGEACDVIDGVQLRLRVSAGHFDFFGTEGPHSGNLNAPVAVVRAAVIYALRVIVGQALPLNEGVLRAVRLTIPVGSVLDPPAGAAVVGGNVETSQRLVDLVFRALGVRAGSQGTMNNLSVGAEQWAFYETIGGGLGASPVADGRSGGQVHMTNTRATDPEVLEARLPLRVRRFELRNGSGGAGATRGGDGLVRELELREGATVALLAAWRREGAAGVDGGKNAASGQAFVVQAGVERPWDGAPHRLAAGDRVRVETPGGGGFGPAAV